MLLTCLMNFLLILSAFGIAFSPGDDAWEFDFNNNGQIDVYDIMDMLSMKPVVKEFGIQKEK